MQYLQARFGEKRLHGRPDGKGGLSPRTLRLQWDCVDFENGTISITRTVVKVTTVVEKNRRFFDSLIKVTANIYGHPDVRRKQRMADAPGAALTGERKAKSVSQGVRQNRVIGRSGTRTEKFRGKQKVPSAFMAEISGTQCAEPIEPLTF